MILALLITVGYVFLVWLVFFRFKWIQFSITWAVVSNVKSSITLPPAEVRLVQSLRRRV
jgi:hypothetical protein